MPEALVIGFPDESPLVEALALAANAKAVFASQERFSAGEWRIRGPVELPSRVYLTTNIGEEPHALFRACLLAHAARQHGATEVILLAPWIAYGRQDRVCHPGDAPAGLLVGTWLQEAFDQIHTFDAHSDTFIESFGGKLHNVYTNPGAFSSLREATIVVAPDEGAEERATVAAKELGLPVLVLTKIRHKDGVETTLPVGLTSFVGQIPLLVDDMSDTGGTLIAAAEQLRGIGASKVLAFIPHALRRQILETRTAGIIDTIECAYDHEAGIYAPEQLPLLVQSAKQASSLAP